MSRSFCAGAVRCLQGIGKMGGEASCNACKGPWHASLLSWQVECGSCLHIDSSRCRTVERRLTLHN